MPLYNHINKQNIKRQVTSYVAYWLIGYVDA